MSYSIHTLLLLLFVINHGIALGAGLYEQQIVVPLWMGRKADNSIYINSDTIKNLDTGRRFWAVVTTSSLTLLTLANLFITWHATHPSDIWLRYAAIITLCERIATFGYFIPTLIKLMRVEAQPTLKAQRMAMQWIMCNRLRLMLSLAGWLFALKALSLLS